MIESSFNKEVGNGFSRNIEERIYYGLAGYRIRIDRDWHIEPSILLRNLDDGDPEYNFSTRVFYSDQIWSGISIRSNSSIAFSIGTNADKNQIAYSFDYYFGEIQSYQNGTHEITMSFKLPNYNK